MARRPGFLNCESACAWVRRRGSSNACKGEGQMLWPSFNRAERGRGRCPGGNGHQWLLALIHNQRGGIKER
jgi:hypothetical protein